MLLSPGRSLTGVGVKPPVPAKLPPIALLVVVVAPPPAEVVAVVAVVEVVAPTLAVSVVEPQANHVSASDAAMNQ